MPKSDAFRTVWLSDLHLGTRACHAGLLLDFLERTECETLYLVGDVIDLQSLRSRFYWPKSHTDILQRILHKARNGTRVIYIPGNHDEDFRVLTGTRFAGIEIEREHVHTTANGKRLLVLHGDVFDAKLKGGVVSALVGCVGYRLLLALNRFTHRLNDAFGRPYWSLAQSVKSRVGKAVHYVARYREVCLHAAREAGLDGVICGHIHKAEIVRKDGLIYCNDGDWVESCTAVTERADGELELCHWGIARSAPQEKVAALALEDAA